MRKQSPAPGRETILEEAQRLVHGDRQGDYGHPLDNFTQVAEAANAMLGPHKFNEGLVAEDIALILILVKLSRQMNSAKRDNLVDVAGYAETWNMVIEERKNRA